ncbi:MAG: glycosyltransferase family 4 protein [Pirellulales bacterium]|nr:glycosyltransferase family 4 protein [Pirellulales bacterium]
MAGPNCPKKKILILTNLDVWVFDLNSRIAGAGHQVVLNTLLGFANAGYEVHMITTSRLHSELPPIHDNVHIHRLPLPWFDLCQKLISIPKYALRKLRSFIKSTGTPKRPRSFVDFSPPALWYYTYYFFRPTVARYAVKLARRIGGVDVVYGHEVVGAIAAETVSKQLRVPLVTRFQGTELSQFLDQPERLMRCKTHVVALRADADLIIMANDGTLGDQVLDFLGVPKKKYRFYIDGVVKDDVHRPDVDVQAVRKRFLVPDDCLFLLYAGRMFYWKRIDRLLEVAARVKQDFDDFRLVVVGDGPEMAAVQTLARNLEVTDHVRFVGAMPHGDLMDLMNACDVYVSFHDLTNLCNPALEACVCGKCIATTAIGGIQDLLTDNVNAVVCEPHDDVDGIAKRLLRLLRNPEERKRLRDAAFQQGKTKVKTWVERMEMEVAEIEKTIASSGASRT